MKILVTGAKGQLGFDVVRALKARNDSETPLEVLGVDLEEFDLTNREETRRFLLQYKPQGVIHCAAYTAVDRAEEDKALCYQVNVTGTENLAEACRDLGAKMVYISTDYVFSGERETPHEVGDPTYPINYYGETKLEGERKVRALLKEYFIIRTSWVFGAHGHNFVQTMLKLGKEQKSLRVVHDQWGSPTYTRHLAELVCDILLRGKFGTYHATNEGFCSWHEFATEIFNQAQMPVQVIPVSSEEYKTKAKRSLNSRLSKDSLDIEGFQRLPDWKIGLAKYLDEINKGDQNAE